MNARTSRTDSCGPADRSAARRRPSTRTLRLGAALPALVIAATMLACALPPELPYTQITFNLDPITDNRTTLKFVRSFDLRVLQGTLNNGTTALTCDDFPTTYTVDDPNLVEKARKQITWQGQIEATQFKLRVPSDMRLVFVVRGLGQNATGTHIVMRGCQGNQTFDSGSDNQVVINAYATLGAACSTSKDCEKGLTCLTNSSFPHGYCTLPSCSSDGQCPPGSYCIRGSSSTLCARICVNGGDCEPRSGDAYDCEARTDQSGKCVNACVYPTFNAKDSCNK